VCHHIAGVPDVGAGTEGIATTAPLQFDAKNYSSVEQFTHLRRPAS